MKEGSSFKDAALVLLVSLPPSFKSFVSSFVVGKDTITLEDVRTSLHSRELHQQALGSGYDADEALRRNVIYSYAVIVYYGKDFDEYLLKKESRVKKITA
ncbi:hypothetical protein Tco_0280389 [Tanacetum coccineum]